MDWRREGRKIMSRITGTLYIDFETDKTITQDQFKNFRNKLNKSVNDWETNIEETAAECGFESCEVHPILLDDIDCEFGEDEDDE